MLFKKQKKPEARQPRLMSGQDDYAFRRSRTLTGTTSAKVKPGAESRAQLKTPRLKEHELLHKRRQLFRALLGALACVAAMLLLMVNLIVDTPIRYPQAGTGTPTTAVYKESIRQYLQARPLEYFGFALNERTLQDFMRQKHPELSTLSISQAWYGGVQGFTVMFRKPILVWQSGTERFFVDDQGASFSYDHFAAPLVAVEDQSGVAPDVGNSVASSRFIRFLGKMVGAVNAGGRGQVVSVAIPASTRQIDLKLEGRDYPIKTHIDRDPLQQAEDALVALRYFDERAIKPAYVDVRVGGRAFYK